MSFWDRFKSTPAGSAASNIGNVLLKMGLVTEDQLRHAVDVQNHQEAVKLGRVFVDMGILTEAQLADALEKQRKLRTGQKTEALAEIVEAQAKAATERLQEILDDKAV